VSRAAGAALIGLAAAAVAAPHRAPHRAFTVQALTPVSGSLSTVTATFVWSVTDVPPSGSPVTYRLILGSDPGLVTRVLDTTLTDVLTFTTPRAIKPVSSLFWRVDARAASGETATTGPTGPLVVPPWATLTALSNPGGTTTFDVQPTLSWTPVYVSNPPGPFTYDVFVRRVGAAFDAVGIGGLTQTQITVPTPLERSVSYTWSLVVRAGSDTSLVRSAGSFLVVDPSTPPATLLYQNFPNPFPGSGRDSTCLWFDLASASLVELDVLDLRGALVRRFIPGPDFPAILTAGRYGRGVVSGGGVCDPRLMWDGKAADGRDVPGGVYLYRLRAGGTVQFKRIVFRGRSR
jgi:hypothetical protein